MVADEASRVAFRLLGPVEMWVGARRLDAGQPRQRALLAALLVDVGRVVPIETLIERVWGQAVPEHARATLRTHLSRIRRLLEQAGQSVVPVAALSHVSGGYLLQLDSDQVDLHLFRRLAGTAAHGAGAGSPVESLRAALALWQGQPLTGIDGEWAGRMRAIWCRERVDAAVAWARAELAQANPRPVLASLAELASDNPLVESLTEMLMLAMHAAGRTSEALDLYARTRANLAEQLGTDPGPDLQRLHRSLLRGEVETAPAAGPPRDVPRQLPAPPQLFTGRTMELAELDKIHDASTVVITAIDGMAGVGKTALAVQAAHQMVDRYPDGQLFIDLHGYTEGVAPVEPGAALDWMLRSLGVGAEQIPAALDQRAGLYRSRVAEHRMVIILDNAATEAQVSPLLPGAPGCVVLVTSRRRLTGLDHTHTVSLDTLPLPDAVALLRQTDRGRLDDQPAELVAELVDLCGRLPLAIRIAAARLRAHPAWDLMHLVRRLRDQQHRLFELATGPRSVTAALDLSYQDLKVDEQRTYRLLGLHPGPDVDPFAAAALLDATLLEAGRLLEQLLGAHLLQEPAPGRFRFHDLPRAHAAHTATRDGAYGDHQAALVRLLDYYRYTAAAAMDAAYPYEREHRRHVPPARTPGPELSDPVAALSWLNSELPSLRAAVRYASEHDRPAHLLDLSSILHRHLRANGLHHDAETLHKQALTAARATGHQAAEMEALKMLGHIHRIQGRYDQAADHLEQALRLARASGHQVAEVEALTGLGQIHRLQGRYEQAADHLEQALRLARATGHRVAELDALMAIGNMHRMQCRYDQAGDHHEQALRLARATGHQAAELDALIALGLVHRVQGRYQQATDHLEQALQLARTTGHVNAEQAALTSLGQIHRLQGRHEQATAHLEQALQLARATGHRIAEERALAGLGDVHRLQGRYKQAKDDYLRLLDLARQHSSRNYQFEALLGLGRVHHGTGDPSAALIHHDQALELANELDQTGDQARAHDGLARAHNALRHPEQARTHWRHALDILTHLRVDHTEDEETTVAAIRAHLGQHPTNSEETEPTK
jgi:DNA-binding SARP family transcriptional activator/tetratricopeptide (TPR) repeat protein